MPRDNRFEPRRWRARPPKPKISSNLLQSVGERREVDMRKNERKKVHRVLRVGYRAQPSYEQCLGIAHTAEQAVGRVWQRQKAGRRLQHLVRFMRSTSYKMNCK